MPLHYTSVWTLWVLPPFLFVANEKYYFHTQGPGGRIGTCTQISALQVRYVYLFTPYAHFFNEKFLNVKML